MSSATRKTCGPVMRSSESIGYALGVKVNQRRRTCVIHGMSGFATLAPPYSMPSASHGDVELSDSTTNSQSRALNQFLAGVELKAFKIAQAALRHEDDALDAVQDAMLQLARAYSERRVGKECRSRWSPYH